MASDESLIETLVDQINGYLNRPRKYYDPKTAKFAVGSFYVDKSVDRKGKRCYRICEVISEDGGYKAYAEYGLKTEEVRIWLDGLTTGINVERRANGEDSAWVKKGL